MSGADYAGLVTAAHNQLHAPVILIWDNLNTHISTRMRTLLWTHQDWLTVVQLPACAPDLNPVEGAWSNMKNGLGNLGSCSAVRQLAAIIKNRLKRIQYQPALIDGFLARPDSASNPNHRRRNQTPGLSICSRRPAGPQLRAHRGRPGGVDGLVRVRVTTGRGSVGPRPGAAITRPAPPQTFILDGQRLRQLRRQRGLSQEELAAQAGVSRTTIVWLERQASAPGRGRTLGRLAGALGEHPATTTLRPPDV
jgi:DNA-binding Xre family transcriptional regulator